MFFLYGNGITSVTIISSTSLRWFEDLDIVECIDV